jgi:hypothetical protein
MGLTTALLAALSGSDVAAVKMPVAVTKQVFVS